jgi:CheY-like chemotaxis protein
MVIAVVDDLLFSSKIRAVAQASGAPVTFARSLDAALTAVLDEQAELVIIDLEGRIDAIAAIRAIRQTARPDLRIVGYGSHVNVERLQAARDAGCDQPMPRSAFVAALPGLLVPSSAGAR